MNLRSRFRPSSMLSRRLFLLTLALLAATSALIWLGYQATQDARRSARLLLERRVSEQHALLWAGLTQDMKGAHATVLAPITPSQLVLDPPYDLAQAFARGFARFPYPEVFFVWKDTADGSVTYEFSRTDRPPAWGGSERLGGPYPVEVARDPPALAALIAGARQRARFGGPLAVFPVRLGGTPYQAVVTYLYDDDAPMRVSGLVGFAVNLEWVRRSYFGELVSQMARIGGDPSEISLQVLDPAGTEIASTGPQRTDIAPVARSFPLVFVDRALLGVLPPEGVVFDRWSARAGVAATSSRAAATAGGSNAYLVASLAAILFVAGLAATIRSVRAAAELASMKSDFVSSVTHELKTPLAVIQLIADTLVRGRYRSPDAIPEYAGMLAREARSLSSLVDNLLAYARLSDVRHAYTFEAVDVGDLVDVALEHVQALLAEGQFAVQVDVPPSLPPIRADRSAMLLALDNVLDNAIKYSGETRVVAIAAAAAERGVTISVQDRGAGIHAGDIGRVGEKFFRGRDVSKRGSGLGLAIVRSVLDAHGGTLHVDSRRGEGTRVEMILPRASV